MLPAEYIERAMDLVKDSGDKYCSIHDSLSGLNERLNEGRFHLAVLGQFKRGKSTLLNALLGEELLPGAILPVTAIPTFIYSGAEHRVHVTFNDNTETDFSSGDVSEINRYLDEHVSEEKNPENTRGIKNVELYTPAPVLRNGLVLIDTPGIGSTHRHNTEVTMNFLEECDAALFVFSPDPPVTEAELDFLKQVRTRVKKIIFVLNKADLLSEEEIVKISGFIKSVLYEKSGVDLSEDIFTLSAKSGLNAAKTGDNDKWNLSGMDRLRTYLSGFLVKEKGEVLLKAVSLKAVNILSEFSMRLHLEARALELPVDDLKRRAELFRKKIEEAMTRREETGDILKGDRKRLLDILDVQSKKLHERTTLYLNEILDKNIKSGSKLSENRIREEFALSIPPFFEHELKEVSKYFSDAVSERMTVHEKRAADLIDEVKSAAADIFEIPYERSDEKIVLIENRKPYWVKHNWSASFIPVPDDLVDALLPRKMLIKKITRNMQRLAKDLATGNVENLSWVTLQNLDDTFRKFTGEFDNKLKAAIEATEGALLEAMKRSNEQETGSAAELDDLKKRIESVTELTSGLKRHSL